jgi:hypothetical protein
VGALAAREAAARDAHHLYDQLLDLLSYEKISFNGLYPSLCPSPLGNSKISTAY